MRVLDLLDDDYKLPDIAHEKEETDNKTDRKKAKEEEDKEDELFDEDEETKIKIWELVKYAFAGLGGAFLIYSVLRPRSCNHPMMQPVQPQNDNQQTMMTLLFLIYQSMMGRGSSQIMDGDRGPIGSTTDPLEPNPKDWMKFYQESMHENADTQDPNEEYTMPEMRIHQNWRVERDLKGMIKNVYKVNEYAR